MGEEQTRPTRRRTAGRRLAGIAAVAALTIGLFWAYLLQSRAQAANSDAAAMVLQGWQVMHGHLLLRGWFLADVSFYTFEVPLDGLISVVYGLQGDVIHVAAAAEYALLVLFAALVAAGAARDRLRGGREAWIRGLIAAGIMVAPGTNPGAHVLLLAPDHTAIGVPVLIALLVVDRVRPSRALPVAGTGLLVGLLLFWAQLDDPVAEFSCALPLALACAAPLAAAAGRRLADQVRARRGGPANPSLPWRRELELHGYDLALLVAAVASFGLTQLANREIYRLGGFYLHAIPAKSQISHWSTVPSQVRTLGQNLMYLFGSNWWTKPQPLTDYAYLHLIGVAVALIGLVIAIWAWPQGRPGDPDAGGRDLRGVRGGRGQPADAADLRHARGRDHAPAQRGAGGPRHRAVAGRPTTGAGRGRGRRPGGRPDGGAGSASRPARAGGCRRPGWRWRACSSRPGSATCATSATTPPSSPGPRSTRPWPTGWSRTI